jgi:hypothetical protein
MNALRELIEAGEQAGRDEVIAAVATHAPSVSVYLALTLPKTGSLERVIKAAVDNAKDDIQADAIRRFGVGTLILGNRFLRDENAELRQQLTELRDENASLRQDLTEVEAENVELNSILDDVIGEEEYVCDDCLAAETCPDCGTIN